MYNLPSFKEKTPGVVLDFIHQHPFAFITGCNEHNQPVATQIPVFIDERDGVLFLSGHMMRNTDHHRAFVANPEVLCVFHGPHSYVSATWYTHPQQASTWIYMSVHVRGSIRFLNDEELVAVLRKTSLHFEGANDASPTSYDNLPIAYRNRLLPAIVAFEIPVEKIEEVFKLSQNQDEESFRSIIRELQKGYDNARQIAAEMQKRAGDLFFKHRHNAGENNA